MATIITLTDTAGKFPIEVVAEHIVYYEEARRNPDTGESEADVHLSSGAKVRVAESVEVIHSWLTTGFPPKVEIKAAEPTEPAGEPAAEEAAEPVKESSGRRQVK